MDVKSWIALWQGIVRFAHYNLISARIELFHVHYTLVLCLIGRDREGERGRIGE